MKKSIQERLQTASRKWNLTGITCIYEKETRGVYDADSAEFGPVILKINANSDSLAREYHTLTDMKGTACCQAYAFDNTYGLLLEEKVLQGTPLERESDYEKRAACFAQVFEKIHVVPKDSTNYSSYLNWVQRACKSVENQTNMESSMELSDGMHLAVEIAEKMFKKYPERVLLHGDLHHENILQSKSGNYVIIDPKGVIGPPVFDIPRFVLNELDKYENSRQEIHIDKVIQIISRLLKYPVDDIYQLFFMEVMLANAWNFEDGEELMEKDINFAWKIISARHLENVSE